MTRPGEVNQGTESHPDNKEEQAKKASGKADVAHKPGGVEAADARSTESRDLGTKSRSVGDGTEAEEAEQSSSPGKNSGSKFNPPS